MEFDRTKINPRIHNKISECFERERVLQKLILTCFMELTDILLEEIEKEVNDERWRTGSKADAGSKQETNAHASNAPTEGAFDAPAARKSGR